MSENQGKFCWYDLMTSDVIAAQAFYKTVVGWEINDSGMTDRQYSILSVGEEPIGGMLPFSDLAKQNNVPPHWTGYIYVDSVDTFVTKVKSAGGSICKPAEDIPGIGRFAVVADPHGASFILFQSNTPAPPKKEGMAPCHIGWHELHAGHMEEAFTFYADLFGWTKDTAMDMGPMGTYQLFRTGGDGAVGGMMTKADHIPRPFWLYYFSTSGIDAAVDRVKSAGGKIRNGPMEVPGGAWIIQCSDPQGAMFAMVGSK